MQAHTDVAEALDRLRELAAVRHPDDEVLGQFLALYYFELPEEDVDDRKIDDIYSVGVAHFELGRTRPAGSPVVRVMSPDRERDGWATPHSVVLMVTDDMPFLVDTMRMLLERHGLDIHLLVHPMLLVERGAADEIRRVAPFSDRLEGRADETLIVEAWTQIEIDRVSDELAADLESELESAIADVRRVVGDFGRIRERLLELVDVHPAMQWFADGQFVFLGAVDTTCDESGAVAPIDGTALGQLADVPPAAREAFTFSTSSGREDRPAVMARADTVSTVFRPQRLSVLIVGDPASQGCSIGSSACSRQEPNEPACSTFPGLATRSPASSASSARRSTATPAGRRGPSSRTFPATSSSSSRPRRSLTSFGRSSGCRNDASSGCSRFRSLPVGGRPCSCTSPATGSPLSCRSDSPTSSPRPTAPRSGRSSRSCRPAHSPA